MREKVKQQFSTLLLQWYHRHKRDLPWRHVSDPYPIWLSEIMLQQTRVDTVIPYYHRFLKAFPDIATLSAAPLSRVLKLWEGMGYYARARNLHKAAHKIMQEYNGLMPSRYVDLLALPGIGRYTAAAIASIAFGEMSPVLDGNVMRVIARLQLIREPLSGRRIEKSMVDFARTLMPDSEPGNFNQAMMELGALVCLPLQPKCGACPVSFSCQALQKFPDPAVLPLRNPVKEKPHHDIGVGVVWRNGRVLLDQRPLDGLLGGLWEFPGGKLEEGETLQNCVAREILSKFRIEILVGDFVGKIKHSYTHFRITLHAFHCQYVAGEARPVKALDCVWVEPAQIARYALPRSNQRLAEMLLATDGSFQQ